MMTVRQSRLDPAACQSNNLYLLFKQALFYPSRQIVPSQRHLSGKLGQEQNA